MSLVLKILKGSGEGELLAIPNGQAVTLGRGKDSSYQLADQLLSRAHCSIERRESQISIKDLESRNGTFVNGERLAAPRALRAGDRIKIGATIIEVTDPTAPPAPAAPAAPAPPLPTLTGFKILECVQVTATGPVYKAEQELMKRLVLVKTLSTNAKDDEEKSRRRFMREAKAGGRLNHPSIVELYDVNEQDGVMYLVLEWIDGETLAARVKAKGALPASEVLPWIQQIGEGLQYAHEQSIVHRNVTPDAVFVLHAEGRAKLSDFTVAKRTEEDRSVITLAGESLGTPIYMAPEVMRNALAADVRSDLYSLASTFYYALTGKLPVEARNLPEFMRKVLEKPPTLAERVPGIPAALSAAIEKAMEKDPSKRQESVRVFLDELAPLF